MVKKPSLMRRLRRNKSGNATLLVALGMPALIGAAGFGIDMAQLYMWKRELQHSVDQAAMAGAWALAYDKKSTNYTTRAQQEFDANQKITSDFDSTPNVQLASYDGGVNNSVLVSASVTKSLPFSSFLTNKPLHMQAVAQATFADGATYKACLLALKKGSSGTFSIGGNATVNASCGLGALSCEAGAIEIGGSSSVTTDTIATCGTASVPTSLQSKTAENVTGLSDAFGGLPAPLLASNEESNAKQLDCKNNKKVSVTPGRYTGGWDVKCTLTMASGIYIIDGGVLDLTSNKGNVTGTGVMFVLRNGATVKLGGSGNANKDGGIDYSDADGASVTLSPMEASAFVDGPNDAYKDQYAGLLIYEDKKDYSNASGQDWKDLPELSGQVDHKINGNSRISMRGTMYLPRGNVTLNGNSATNSNCFQLWAYTLKINGSTNVTTTCSSNQTLVAGTSKGGVRLVG
ncbi:hypothetical protein A6F65_01743 [Paraurantiacibacter namhicola]|uniref:Putative Flp pilus-assembly TadG-like N-terminal domain-containing protein n=2 Tax=Paraurantiacibacter namhicola TaxID=645517 RepID=A0A1C7D981_9SPHN|nr:hypothetical protein A6F65_01743 [Paraurantiacibacter namhicola]